MKNRDIVANFNNLYGIIGKNDKYPVKLSFAIAKNLKMLEPLVKDFEEEKNKILELYCLRNLDGTFQRKKNGEYEIQEVYKQEWEENMKELLEIDVKVEPHMVSTNDYPEDIEPAVILALGFMTQNES